MTNVPNRTVPCVPCDGERWTKDDVIDNYLHTLFEVFRRRAEEAAGHRPQIVLGEPLLPASWERVHDEVSELISNFSTILERLDVQVAFESIAEEMHKARRFIRHPDERYFAGTSVHVYALRNLPFGSALMQDVVAFTALYVGLINHNYLSRVAEEKKLAFSWLLMPSEDFFDWVGGPEQLQERLIQSFLL